jgi:hypothetical protein
MEMLRPEQEENGENKTTRADTLQAMGILDLPKSKLGCSLGNVIMHASQIPSHACIQPSFHTATMPGQPGLPNLTAMRGRRKGGATAPQTTTPQGMAAHAEAFLGTLAARHYSAASIDAHRWALRQFTEWAASRGAPDPSSYQRADLEAYQLFLLRYRSPRGGRGSPSIPNSPGLAACAASSQGSAAPEQSLPTPPPISTSPANKPANYRKPSAHRKSNSC